MDRHKIIKGLIVTLSLLVGVVFYIVYTQNNRTDLETHFEHSQRLAEGADPSIGITEFENGDYSVDSTFESHLPLVVIDLKGQEIPSAYKFDQTEGRFVLIDGTDPYITASISIIDNDSNVNCLGDDPELESAIQIKYRGNSSLTYDKHQYRIKLVDDEGLSQDLDVMGMGAESDWILNISMIDESLIRNYMSYSIVSEFMPYTPDLRFCEVVMKNGNDYEYQGLYLMMEPVEQGSDRVDIQDYSEKNDYTSYLVRRDRYDEEGVMLDTYATKNELCYGYLDLKYPKNEDVTQEVIDYVTNDISEIEKIIFSDDKDTFLQYPKYIDVDSFVDYFILNEFFANYDAGNNSTYMYKDARGKLCMGPIWDYDNMADNMSSYILFPELVSFEGQPWFNKLLQSEDFCKKLEKRYKELRKTYFSDKFITSFVDDTTKYLGNAQKRDYSRWNDIYTSDKFDVLKDMSGVYVYRNFDSYEDEVQRLKDILVEHGSYILKELHKLTLECRYKDAYDVHYEYAVLFLVIFLASVVVGRRKV